MLIWGRKADFPSKNNGLCGPKEDMQAIHYKIDQVWLHSVTPVFHGR